MSKLQIIDWDTTAANNTDVGAIAIQGTSPISNFDNAMREIMAEHAAAVTRIVDKAAGSYTAAKTDHNQLWRATGAVTFNLTAAATLTTGWALWVKGDGGAITVDPAGAELINGAATLTVADGNSAFIVCTGTAFRAIVVVGPSGSLASPTITGLDASTTAKGIVELATDAETQTGTDAVRAITPSNLTAKEATVANYRANTADRILTTDIAWSSAAQVALTDAATIAVDMSTFINASVLLGGNRTLANPTNAKVGQTGAIFFTQDGTGSRTLAFSSAWVFAGGIDPVLSTAAGSIDALFYFVVTPSFIIGNLIKAVA